MLKSVLVFPEVHLVSKDGGSVADIALLSEARVIFDRRSTDVQTWPAVAPAGDFAGSVQRVIRASWWQDRLRVGDVAAALGMSARSLQRRLREAGVRYESLVARSRLHTAAERLQTSTARVVDIALDLGYSDHAHFTRAFRRWTGTTPREFRRRASATRPRMRWTASPSEGSLS